MYAVFWLTCASFLSGFFTCNKDKVSIAPDENLDVFEANLEWSVFVAIDLGDQPSEDCRLSVRLARIFDRNATLKVFVSERVYGHDVT